MIENYRPRLNLYETQSAIGFIKQTFQFELSRRLHLMRATAPLFVDPVSTTKAEKLRPILHKIHTLKPNRIEAELLSGVAIRDTESLRLAAKKLLVLLSLFISKITPKTKITTLILMNIPSGDL
mgnify:CR=1 FL=1